MKNHYKIIFVLRSYGHLYLIRSAIREAADAGHAVLVLFHKELTDETLEDAERFEGRHPNISYGWMKSSLRAGTVVFHAREVLSYRKHLLKSTNSQFYAERWKKYLHSKLQKLFNWSWAGLLLKTGPAGFLLRLIEKVTPPQANVLEHLKELKPDVLIATPVNKRYSSMELEYLKAAKSLGTPSIISITSWDPITAKGVFHIKPDRLLVWNDIQVEEAIWHQDIPREKIGVVGSSSFDKWFVPNKPTPRAEFLAKQGLNPNYPVLAYLCSSGVIAGDEAWLIRELRQVLDSSKDERIRNIQIAIRPYPTNYEICRNLDLKHTAVIPKEGPIENPVLNQQYLYDTIYHSLAFVGINTTSMLDAIAIGKPVIALFTKQYEQMQLGTFHFQALYKEDALDLVDIENKKEEFYKLLVKFLEEKDERKGKRTEFIKRYIRPRGLEVSAGRAILEEMEKLIQAKHAV